MRLSKLVGQRLREAPRDAQTLSHKFMIRGGYCRPVSAGIFSLLPLGRRIERKVEAILREEMDAIGGQEILMPMVLPRELWDESGRFTSVGSELLRFKDRNGKDMLLGMTHEEAVVQIARTELVSYKQLPAMLYQLQLKYRDEARPRAGLIRVREFTMKDAYSFHTSQEDLEEYYKIVYDSYVRIFHRIGLKNCISIKADSGMMGGGVSDEFMAIADCGEDTLFCSPDNKYRANREVACAKIPLVKEEPRELELKQTPDCKTIEDVAKFLGLKAENTCKAVFYRDYEGKLVFVNIRGDIEVNEAKLRKILQTPELEFAEDELIRSVGAVPGFASLYGLDLNKMRVVVDPTVAGSSNLVIGANKQDFHYLNFNYDRDVANKDGVIVADVATVREDDLDCTSGQPLKKMNGIEVGNIFQLGTKYSKPMNCTFLDQNGKSHPMIMGCYGIGVGRAFAAVLEQNHDDYGPIWPITIAPYQVQLVGLNHKVAEVQELCEKLYHEMQSAGIEVLYDDRGGKAGASFADADLLGLPFRVIVSPKTLAENQVEFKCRDWGRRSELLPIEGIIEFLKKQIAEAFEKYSA